MYNATAVCQTAPISYGPSKNFTDCQNFDHICELLTSELLASLVKVLCSKYQLNIMNTVGWSLMSIFSTNTAISETKGQGGELPLTQWSKASDINLNTGCRFVQQPPKKGKGLRGSLNYYASTYNRGRQLMHRKTKLNQIQQNTRINLN